MTNHEALAATIILIMLLSAYCLGHAEGYRKGYTAGLERASRLLSRAIHPRNKEV